SGSASGSAPAPSGSSLGLTPCALGCITAAATASDCKTFTNATCVCTDINFQTLAAMCLTTECQAAEAQAAIGIQGQQCGPLSLSATGSATVTAPFAPSNTAADINSTASGSGAPAPSGSGKSTTGAASPLLATGSFEFAALVGAAVVALVGGVVV
ncbi:hypothetical protein C8R46DRAFT_1082061, partial [Mycena filopes]